VDRGSGHHIVESIEIVVIAEDGGVGAAAIEEVVGSGVLPVRDH
jgi:hypothetical protein